MSDRLTELCFTPFWSDLSHITAVKLLKSYVCQYDKSQGHIPDQGHLSCLL